MVHRFKAYRFNYYYFFGEIILLDGAYKEEEAAGIYY
jgi:hypothetical protein